MNENSYTEITTNSFGRNIKNSFVGLVLGLILFLVSIFVLWFNEGNLAKQNQIAIYINKNAIPVESISVDKINDNKLISTSGNAITDESLTDGIITIPNALVLSRKVEMYQWKENQQTKTDTNLGGSSTKKTMYSYEKVWSEYPINSSNFHKTLYVNPSFTIKSERFNAQKGDFGDFVLSNYQTSSFNNLYEYLNLPQNPKYVISGNYYYKTKNIESPNIGDIRISYKYMPSDSPISVIGMQRTDKTITPIAIKQGNVYIQYDGLLTKAEMIEKFKKNNIVITNIFRFVGFLLMFIGLNLILRPIAVLLSFIPIFEKIISFLSGGLVFLISAVLSLIIIAISWAFYRPILTIGLSTVVAALIVLIKNKIKQQ